MDFPCTDDIIQHISLLLTCCMFPLHLFGCCCNAVKVYLASARLSFTFTVPSGLRGSPINTQGHISHRKGARSDEFKDRHPAHDTPFVQRVKQPDGRSSLAPQRTEVEHLLQCRQVSPQLACCCLHKRRDADEIRFHFEMLQSRQFQSEMLTVILV